MKNNLILILSVFILAISLNSCYEEHLIIPDHKNNVFNFQMASEIESRILDSRGEIFFLEPVPVMDYGGILYNLDYMKLRGQSVLNYQRKSFSVNVDKQIYLTEGSNSPRNYEKFKLISLVYDYTYIENRLSHVLLNEISLWPLSSFFTEVKLNNHHQGLYMFIEDPDTYLFDFNNAEAVLRRNYRNNISTVELNTTLVTDTESYYVDQFKSLYKIIVEYSGEQLFNEISRHLNIQNYMRKMAFDFIIQNGDYTDEIFFYALEKEGVTYFDILPWDYDDIFSSIQHEVNRDWAVGTVFGVRTYTSKDEVLEVLNGRLIFSIEDDLDYIIAMDDYLYQKYLIELKYVLSIINSSKINSVFELLNKELLPFYQKTEIIEQSEFDSRSTTLELFTKNIKDKEAFLLDRVSWISNELITL